MVRTTLIAKNTDIHLVIPQEYVGKTIEITYLALDELESKPAPKKKLSELAGKLSAETADAMLKEIEDGRKGWEERLKKQI